MVLTRTVEAQARIRVSQKELQKRFNGKLDGTDFTFFAAPLPDRVLLVAAGHEKFDQLKKLAEIGPGDEFEDESEYRKTLLADSIWAAKAAYESKESRYAIYLGITAVHLGLIPSVGKKATVRLLPNAIEIWHPDNWVAAATKVNAELLGYVAI